MCASQRLRNAACALLATLALGCSSTVVHSRSSSQHAAEESDATARLAAELADAAALRANLSTMRVAVHELVGKDSEQSYGPVAAAREVELASLGIALKEELVSTLSRRMYVLAPESADGSTGTITGSGAEARATHRVVGHFMRIEDDLLVSLRLVDADSSVIVSSARGTVPLMPLVKNGALAWTTHAPPAVNANEREPERGGPSVPGPAGPDRTQRAATPPGPTAPGPATAAVDDGTAVIEPADTEAGPEGIEGSERVADGSIPESLPVATDELEQESVPGPAAIRMRRLSDSQD